METVNEDGPIIIGAPVAFPVATVAVSLENATEPPVACMASVSQGSVMIIKANGNDSTAYQGFVA